VIIVDLIARLIVLSVRLALEVIKALLRLAGA